MADMERTRVRERGAIEESPYEIFLRSRKEFDQRQMEGPVVIKPSDREYQITRQGRMFYYLNSQAFKDTTCTTGASSPRTSRPIPASTGTRAGSSSM